MAQETFDQLVTKKLISNPMQYHMAALEVLKDMDWLGVDCSKQYDNFIEMLSW